MHPRKNFFRKVGWIGRDDVDFNHVFFRLLKITTSSKHQQVKEVKICPMDEALVFINQEI